MPPTLPHAEEPPQAASRSTQGPASFETPASRAPQDEGGFRSNAASPSLLLQAKGLSISYGTGVATRVVVRDVSLSLARGETLGIVGESGSGKTTLGRALLGLIRPSAGRILFDGQDITALDETAWRPLRRRMQMIFQDPMSSLNPRQTIGRILTGPLLLHRLARTRREAEAHAAEALDRVGLPRGTLRRYPHELSGGQRQRVGIARAVLLKPDFVLADEIVSGLDVSTQAQVLHLIGDLSRAMGLAMAFISHDLSVIRAVCDRVIVLKGGVVAEEGRCDTIFTAPAAPYTRSLIDAIPLPVPDPEWLSRSAAPSA